MHNPIIRTGILAFAAFLSANAQTEWTSYGGDPGSQRYSKLKQIDTKNVQNLKRAWTFHTGDSSGFFESAPLVINSVVYFTSPNAGVFALELETGKQIWKYEAKNVTRRGLSYWPGDAQSSPRLITGVGNTMIALDLKTGKLIPGFGKEGVVDIAPTRMESAPVIYKDIVINPGVGNPVVQGWSARDGSNKWTFHTIAQPGDPGHDTWIGDSWQKARGTYVWGMLSLDAERGIVYLPTKLAGGDYYGGERVGDNLYGTSIVAVDATTGKLKWYKQIVHHDIWDYDLEAPPMLYDAVVKGKKIPALAETSKVGSLYILDRTNGEPIFGMEERPVPQTTTPTEVTSPTQLFTVKPVPLARTSMKKEDLYNLSPEHEAFCKNLWEKYNAYNDGPFTPYSSDPAKNSVIFPGAIGGGNWGGVSFDPASGYIFVNIHNTGQWGHMEKSGNGYRKVSPTNRFWDSEKQWPCQNPPWGEMIAVNGNTGDIAWRSPLGSFAELDKLGVPKTGTANIGGSLATAGGLVFIAATLDHKFHAFDAKTGKELWTGELDATGSSLPTTVMGRNGKQYVILPTGGGGFLHAMPTSDTIVAFALP